MTVGDLKRLLENSDMSDDTPLVVCAPDHEYRVAYASYTTALDHRDGFGFTEDPHSDDPYYEQTFGPVVRVLLFN